MKFNVTEVEFDFDDDYANGFKLTFDEEIGHFLRASEELGVSCQYLAEEFVFESDTFEEFERLHLDDDYLKIKWRLDS